MTLGKKTFLSMNRFDESFNDIDRTTGRPFSYGHHDGVWLITIIYLLFVIGAIARAVLTLLYSEGSQLDVELIVPILITSALYVPPLVLLFRRSKMAVVWMVVLAMIFLASGIAAGMKLDHEGKLGTAAFLGIAGFVATQAYIAFYTYGLKRDVLLR
jgi:hypothetical protein